VTIPEAIESIGLGLDVIGVAVIVLGAGYSAVMAVAGPGAGRGYTAFRQNLGRTILLGLELLVAADIVRTVAVTPSLEGVLILGLIVLIRTFLSITLEVELDGRWPWRRDAQQGGPRAGAAPASDTDAPRRPPP
jgi:uncharacterized membrane protein